ncbi:hypothetical protein [Paenibacillus sp. NPDC057967]|uniref:hypothetical protein n=1 Tax=Paenibacillus sp. NPDC057967 TaxID=3346293 RepID=UPI0036D8AC89
MKQLLLVMLYTVALALLPISNCHKTGSEYTVQNIRLEKSNHLQKLISPTDAVLIEWGRIQVDGGDEEGQVQAVLARQLAEWVILWNGGKS